jgi:asparagine synthase (glutamine-hydrolysing)
MCGICGEWSSDGVDSRRLAEMSRALGHRGPDDEGVEIVGRAGLALRRLSIVDIAGGHQPIANEDGSLWLVCNGEIYNSPRLRQELSARGHVFRSRSDVEVILHLYEEVGEDLVDDLRGMFAFALWDAPRKTLLLARDRFGQKPLYYHWEAGRRFSFASEVKAILAGLTRVPPVDLDSVDDFLALRFVPSPRTMFEGIRKLPPGHRLVLEARAVEQGGEAAIEVEPYYRLRYIPKQRIDAEEAVAELGRRLRETVSSHLLSDVPVGAYLSGGMDSSVIVALMAEQAEGPVPTFAIGVKEADYSELPFARSVAEWCGTEHHEEVVSPDLVRLLPKMIHHLDEPSDPIAACMYHSAALASRHVKVVLGGDGGDEMFAGFDRYFGFRWAGRYARVPSAIRSGLLAPILRRLPGSTGFKSWPQRLLWLDELSRHEGGRRYAQATAFFRFGEKLKRELYSDGTAARLGERDATEHIVRAFEEAIAEGDLDRMLDCDLRTRLSEHSLMLTDRLTMAHGLEARSPFLDHQLAEFVATLPEDLKMRGRRLKYVLRRCAEPWLPPAILRRPKIGFMFPLDSWIRGPLMPLMRSLFGQSLLVEAGVLRFEPMNRLLEEHGARAADHHVRLWMLLNLEIWYRMFVAGHSADDLRGLLEELAAGSGSAVASGAGSRAAGR